MSRYRKKRQSCNRNSRRDDYRTLDRGLYRSREGVILGVFKGLADYFDLSVRMLRFIGVIILFISGFWPIVGIYLLAAFIMKPEPVIPFETLDESEFYDNYTHSRSGAVHRMKQKFENLNRRIQRMEDIVTDTEFDWDQRLNNR